MKPADLHITLPLQSTSPADPSSPSDPRVSSFFSKPYTGIDRPARPPALSVQPFKQTHHASSSSSSSTDTYDEKIDATSPLLPPPGGGREYPFKTARPSAMQSSIQRLNRARLGLSSRVEKMRWSGRLAGKIGFFVGLTVALMLVFKHAMMGSKGEFVTSKIKNQSSYIPYLPYSSSSSSHLHPAPHSSSPWFLPPPPLDSPHSHPLREIDISSEPLPLDATLEERLLAWEMAPGGRGPGIHPSLIDGSPVEEVELGSFNVWSSETCGSNIEPQLNTHMVQKSANIWGSMNRSTLHDTRMRLIDHLREHADETVYHAPDELKDEGGGRGIVMAAGNADTLRRVIWSVRYMRDRGSTLPVQIYHFPEERPSDDDPLRKELEDLGVQLVEAEGERRDEGKSKSYHLKAIAVIQSPWREVLYLDSDSIPVRDPEYMFDSPVYKRLGLWAAPDYWKTSGNNAIWAILGIRCRNEWEMEAGQMFIDKGRHLDVFILIRFMLQHHDYWFYYSDGDKDIFRWAMLGLRKRWGVPGRWVGAAALPSGTASGDFCSHTMLQHDAWGEPLFVHYNLLKQIPSGVGRGFSWGRTKQMPLFNTVPPPTSQSIDGDDEDRTAQEGDLRGLGDVDCDMVADADDEGMTRSPAKMEVRRRAARERGIKAKYHGGWISALCIDLEYFDPRPEHIRNADRAIREVEDSARQAKQEAQETARTDWRNKVDKLWEQEVKAANDAGLPEPERPEGFGGDFEAEAEDEVWPRRDWEQSPVEVVQWSAFDGLRSFENDIYDMGFVPSGPGF